MGIAGFSESTGFILTNIVARTSTTQNVTTTITPAAGEHHQFMVLNDSTGPAAIGIVELSANSGTNFSDIGDISSVEGAFINVNADNLAGNILLNSASRFRWTNPATAGTYITLRIGTIMS